MTGHWWCGKLNSARVLPVKCGSCGVLNGHHVEARLTVDGLWDSDCVYVLSHINVATIVGPRSIVELTLEPDPWIDTKLVLVEARDFASEMRGTSARCDLIGAEILHVVLKHEKAEGAAISVANVEASGVPQQVLVNVELLSAWSQVVIGRRSWHSWLDLDSERPVARTTSVKVTVFKVVLLTANQGDPNRKSLADFLVDAIVNVVLLVEVAEVCVAIAHKKLLNRRWIRWVS